MLIIKVFDPILDLSGLLGENLGAGRGSPGGREGDSPHELKMLRNAYICSNRTSPTCM
jgi:hypothetical protein